MTTMLLIRVLIVVAIASFAPLTLTGCATVPTAGVEESSEERAFRVLNQSYLTASAAYTAAVESIVDLYARRVISRETYVELYLSAIVPGEAVLNEIDLRLASHDIGPQSPIHSQLNAVRDLIGLLDAALTGAPP